MSDTELIPVYVETLIQWLRDQQISITDPEEVRAYLVRYPELMPRVRLTCERALSEFEDTAQLALVVAHTPEGSWSYLALCVRQNHYMPDILQRCERLRIQGGGLIAPCNDLFWVTTVFQTPH